MLVTMQTTQLNSAGELFQMNYEFIPENNDFSNVLGSLLNDMFSFMAACKKHSVKGYVTNKVVDVKITAGELSIDTAGDMTSFARHFRANLKVRHDARSKHRFALLVHDMFDFITHTIANVTFEELLEKLANEATENFAEKFFDRQLKLQAEQVN